MASLSNTKIKDTYQSLVKFSDNGNITIGAKRLTDGFGNNSPLYVSTTQIGIGITPQSGYGLHVSSDVKIGGELEVSGNLTVNGTLTYLNVVDLEVDDPLIQLAVNNAANILDIGLFGKYASSGTKYKGLFNDASDDKFKLFTGLTEKPLTTVNTSATGYTVATLVANLEGNVTGDLTGNADTSTKIASITNSNIVQLTTTQTLTNKTLTSPTITGTGAIAGAFTGDLTGNVTGDITGDITGDVTGNLTGDVTGDVTGGLTGNVTGNVTGNLIGNVTGNVTGNAYLNTIAYQGGEGTELDNSAFNVDGIGTTFRWIESNSGATGSTWKKVADVVCSGGILPSGVQMEVKVLQPNVNDGSSASLNTIYYSIAFRGRIDDGNEYNNALVYGQDSDLIRVYKSASLTFELQARSNDDNRDLVVECNITSKKRGKVTPTTTYTDGTTTGGTAYTASGNALNKTKFAGNVQFEGAIFDSAELDDLTVNNTLYFGADATALYGPHITHHDINGAGEGMLITVESDLQVWGVTGNGGEKNQGLEVAGGVAKLYDMNGVVLETVLGGVDVTGTLDVSGTITVDGTGNFNSNVRLAKTDATSFTDINADGNGMYIETAGSTDALSDMRLQARASGAGNYVQMFIKPSNQSFLVKTNGTDALVINSSQNVGIKTTPSAWGGTALQVGQASISQDINSVYIGANTYLSSTGWKRINAQLAGYMRMGTNDGIWSFSNGVTGIVDSVITWNVRMLINSSGDIGIGTSNPGSKLQVEGAVFANGEGNGFMVDTGTAATARTGFMKYQGTEGQIISGNSTKIRLTHRTDSDYVYGGTPTIREDLVIDTSGNSVFSGTITSGAITTPQINLVNSGGGVIDNQTGNIFIQTVSGSGWIFRDGPTGYAEKMRLGSDGNLSVGDGGTGARNARLLLNNVGSQGTPQLMLVDSDDSGKQSEIRFDSGNLIFDYWGGTSRSEYLRIKSDGDVGINVTNPLFKLDIFDAVSPVVLQLKSSSTSGAGFYIDNDRTGSKKFGFLVGNVADGVFNIKDEDAGLNRFVIDTNGNIGITTETPSTKLNVSGGYGNPADDVAYNGFLVAKFENAQQSYVEIRNSANANGAGLVLKTTGLSDYKHFLVGINNDSKLRIGYGTGITNSKDGSSGLTILQNGSVGVGTANPSGASGTTIAIYGGAGQSRLAIKNTATGDGADDGFQIGVGTGGEVFIEQRENNSMQFTTNNLQRILIDSSGYVNIKQKQNSGLGYDLLINIGTSPDGKIGYQTQDQLAANLAVNANSNWIKTGNNIYNSNSANVGIGETSPFAKLHIKGSDTAVTAASAQGNLLVLEDSENGLSILSSTAGAGYINFGDSDDNDVGMIIYGHSTNSMDFWTNAGKRMTIDSSGNLGINISSGIDANLRVDANSAVLTQEILKVKGGGSGGNFGFLVEANNGDDLFKVDTLTYNSFFTNGKVGIGTTSPGTYKLNVAGTAFYGGQVTIDGFSGNHGISFRTGFDPTNVGIRAKGVGTTNRDGLELLGYNGIDFSVNNGGNVAMRVVGVTGTGMGNVGINTGSPTVKLQVNATGGDIDSGNAINLSTMKGIKLTNTLNDNSSVGLWFGTNNVHWSGITGQRNNSASTWGTDLRFYTHHNATTNLTSSNQRMIITSEGSVGIGTSGPGYTLDVTGTIRATSDVIAFSDRRVKENIVTINSALEKVTKLRGVTYTRKDIEDKSTKVGVIAQEVLEVLPEVVETDNEGMYSVAYGNMAGVFIEAIKELENRIKELENKPCNCK